MTPTSLILIWIDMAKIFDGFDFSEFWEDSEYARREYVDKPLSQQLIASIEAELGVRLPASYLELMKTQNGGIPRDCCFPIEVPTSQESDHIVISGISGIGREKRYSLCGELGSRFMQKEWGYPEIGICVCDCPSAGHDMVMLDYRNCGPEAEPVVVHVDQESDFEITFLANSFEAFIRGLVNESVYDTSAEDLKNDLKKIESGSFSTLLSQLLSKAGEPQSATIIRNICRKLTIEKGYFALHSDDLSHMVYDILFYLYTRSNTLSTKEEYLKIYPDMLAFGDGELTTGGYGPDFIEDWIAKRILKGDIVATREGILEFSDRFRRELTGKISTFK